MSSFREDDLATRKGALHAADGFVLSIGLRAGRGPAPEQAGLRGDQRPIPRRVLRRAAGGPVHVGCEPRVAS